MQPKDVPAGVLDIIEAMTTAAVARCHREGIALADFYEALLREQRAKRHVSVRDLFERTFRSLKAAAN